MSTTIYDGTFTGGPTATGSAGNTTSCPDIAATGTANAWKDVAGGLFHLDSSNNLIGVPQSDFTKWLVRPVGEAVQDQSESVYLTYTGVGNKADILLRINGTNAYWWEVRTTGTSSGGNQYALYSLIAGAPTVIRGDASAYTGWTSGHNYYIKVSAVGVSPTTLTLTIFDITTSTTVYTDSHTDATAGLQTTGVAGLQAWNGTATDAPLATRVIITNEAVSPTFVVSPTTATTGTPLTITATGTGTSWVSGTTTFSVAGGTGASISGLSITGQVATFTLNPGSAAGALTIHDSLDSATATVTASASGIAMAALAVSTNSPAGITIGWSAATGGTSPYSYALYRYSASPFTPPGTGVLVGTTSSLSLVDTSPGSADVYYRVIATDNGSNTAVSTQSSVQTALPSRLYLAPWKIAFFGTSITNFMGTTPATIPYLQAAQPLRTVTFGTNQGVSGSTSVDWAVGGSLLGPAISAATSASCTHVFIEIGANDAKSSGGTTTPLNTYITNITGITNAIITAGLVPVLNTPSYIVPVTGGTWDEATSGRLTAFRDAMAGIAVATGSLLGDLSAFDEFMQNQSLLDSGGVHPTAPAGQVVLANLWGQGFLKSLSSTVSGISTSRLFGGL